MPETDNVRVHEDLTIAATSLPGELAARWVRKEVPWLAKQHYLYFLLPDYLGALVEHLAKTGWVAEALSLARVVLEIRLTGEDNRRAIARFDAWHYEQFLLKHFPALLERTGLDGFSMLCDLLQIAIGEDTQEANEDYSWIWRPAIEPHEQNLRHGEIRDALVGAVRDAADRLLNLGFDPGYIVHQLVQRPRPIFRRLALHLAAGHPEHSIAQDLVSNRENFFDERLWHEYSRLLAAVFPRLSAKDQATVLAWLEDGPLDQRLVTDPEMLRKRKAFWQARRLSPLRGHLPESWEQRHSEIVGELGEPEHPDFLSYRSTWTGPTSPRDENDLQRLSADEIASYLKNWTPRTDWQEPTPEGLARVLEAVIAKSPERFISHLPSFHDVDCTYARAIVQGFTSALKAGHSLNWPSVIEFLQWISQQPRAELRPIGVSLDRDPHWGWARKSVVSLLSTAFDDSAISISLRPSVWRVLEVIATDPDPTLEDDKSSTMDPLTRSINSTRSEALHAIVRYGLWIRDNVVKETPEKGERDFDMGSIPEVEACLDYHLDLSKDPSPAVRAVFGRWFPWLVLLDKSWSESRIEKIFPSDHPELRDAAWCSYLACCPAYDEPFRILEGQYSAAVDRLPEDSSKEMGYLGRAGERLGEHLLALVGRGVLAWSSNRELVKRYFDLAVTSDASHAVAFVGRILVSKDTEISAAGVERFRVFWEDLAGSLSGATHARLQVLKPFGWWFASGRFNPEWAFDQLLRVIELTGGVEPDFMVAERLASLAHDYPARSIAALRTLARRDEEGWHVLSWKDSARTLLRAALGSTEAASDARLLIHELGARGHVDLRDLLSS